MTSSIYFQIFMTFLRIGAFTIGGGWAMIPLIEREVVDSRKWINKEEFLDAITLVQILPGVIAINTAVFVGYRIRGFKGSLVAVLGSALPSFFIILGIAVFFTRFQENETVIAIFKGIRPVVISLIFIPMLTTAKASKINRFNAIIPVAAALCIWLLGLSPVYLVIAGALGGILYLQNKKN